MIGNYICRDCNGTFDEEQDTSKLSLLFTDECGIPFHGGPPLYCPKCGSKYMTWLNYKIDFERRSSATN